MLTALKWISGAPIPAQVSPSYWYDYGNHTCNLSVPHRLELYMHDLCLSATTHTKKY
jgi:hypothetical protein